MVYEAKLEHDDDPASSSLFTKLRALLVGADSSCSTGPSMEPREGPVTPEAVVGLTEVSSPPAVGEGEGDADGDIDEVDRCCEDVTLLLRRLPLRLPCPPEGEATTPSVRLPLECSTGAIAAEELLLRRRVRTRL